MSRLNGRRAEAEAQGLRINVAILGAGRIAHSMARTLVAMAADPRYAGLVAPYAVAARDGGRAAAFAAEYGFPVSYGSYDELLADPARRRDYDLLRQRNLIDDPLAEATSLWASYIEKVIS